MNAVEMKVRESSSKANKSDLLRNCFKASEARDQRELEVQKVETRQQLRAQLNQQQSP